MGQGVVVLYGDAIGYEALAPTSSTGITSTLVTTSSVQAKTALITVETQQVRFRLDGTAPTATTGHIIAAGGSYVITGHANIKNARFIDTASGASSVKVTTFA